MNGPCPQMQDRIADSVLGILGPRESEILREHLTGCDACRQYVQGLKGEARSLVALGRQLDAEMEARRDRVIEALQDVSPAETNAGRLFPSVGGFLRGCVRTGGSLKRSLGMACRVHGDMPGTSVDPSPRPSALRLPPGGYALLAHPLRMGVAAALVLGAGVIIGRATAPQPVDVEQLRADLQASIVGSLRPAVQESVRAEVDRRLESGLTANEASLRSELAEQLRGDLQLFATQFTAGSEQRLEKRFAEFVHLIEEARLKDRLHMVRALEQVEQNRYRDRNQIQTSLAALIEKKPAPIQP